MYYTKAEIKCPDPKALDFGKYPTVDAFLT
jgi:hypothetical protein